LCFAIVEWRFGCDRLETAGTARGSRVVVLPVQGVSWAFIRANLRPKNFCLGLITPKVSFF